MNRRLALLVVVGASSCVLDFEQLVLRDAGASSFDAGARDAGAPVDAGQEPDAGLDAGSRWLNLGEACTQSSQCITGRCAGQCVTWASSVADVVMGSTLVAPDGRPWWHGWFTTPVDFGGGPLQPSPVGGANPVVSRRLSDGSEGSTFVLEPSVATLESMAFLADGGSFIAGENRRGFLGTFPVGTANTNTDSYVARLGTGSLAWVTNLGGFRDERRPRITTAPSGDVFVTGWTSSESLDLTWCVAAPCDGGSTFVRDGGAANWMTFVARLDGATGAKRWVTVVRSPSHVDSRAIVYSAVDDTVVVGGAFIDHLTVEGVDGGFDSSAVFGDDAWVVKLAGPSGALVWGRTFGQGNNDSVQSLASDSTGNIYVGGLYSNPAAVAPFAAVPFLSPVVMKLSADNQPQWARVLQAPSPVTPPRAGQFVPQTGFAQLSVLVADDDTVIVSGWADKPLTTSSRLVLNPVGGDENFFFPLTATNALDPSKVVTFKATGGAVATPVLAPNGNLFVSGTFAGTLTLPLDAGTLTKSSDAGIRDFFSASLGRWP